MLNSERFCDSSPRQVYATLLDEGIYVIGFSYPVVPKGKARIRTQLSAAHSPEDVDRAIEALNEVAHWVKTKASDAELAAAGEALLTRINGVLAADRDLRTFAGDLARDRLVVAGDHFDFDPHLLGRFDGALRVLPGRVI